MKLYKEQNKEGEPPLVEAGLFDIAEWMIDAYPDDIFIVEGLNNPETEENKGVSAVIRAREEFKKILRMRR